MYNIRKGIIHMCMNTMVEETFFLSIIIIIFKHMNETLLINALLYFFFFILGVRFGRNISKLEKKKDDDD